MANETGTDKTAKARPAEAEPRGFGEHARGLASEYAHEQGWGLNTEERTHQTTEPQNTDGGNDYDYGARDFGDEPVNTAPATSAGSPVPHTENDEQAAESTED